MNQPTETERIALLAESWGDRQKMIADIKEAVDAFNDTHGEPFSGLWEEEAAVRRCHMVGAAIRVANSKARLELVDPQPFFCVNGNRSMDECRAAVSSLAASVAIESGLHAIAPAKSSVPESAGSEQRVEVNRKGEPKFSGRQVMAVLDAVERCEGDGFPIDKQILKNIDISFDKSLLSCIKPIAKRFHAMKQRQPDSA